MKGSHDYLEDAGKNYGGVYVLYVVSGITDIRGVQGRLTGCDIHGRRLLGVNDRAVGREVYES